jgi:ribonucleoside-diphosphate reductase alpha chain
VRVKLPPTRPGITHKVEVAGHDFYITVNHYTSGRRKGRPAECFITVAKHGSTLNGTYDSIATLLSFALQEGAKLEPMIDRFKNMEFDPKGPTNNPDIPECTSVVDYLFRWLEKEFLDDTTAGDS